MKTLRLRLFAVTLAAAFVVALGGGQRSGLATLAAAGSSSAAPALAAR